MVTSEMKSKWGSYPDRKDSFDDEADISKFVTMVHTHQRLQTFLSQFFFHHGSVQWKWHKHPDGKYGVDLSIVGETTLAIFDIERWSAWKNTWPSFYKHIHFLARKDKYLYRDLPFFMVYLNYNRDKCLIVDRDTILKYPKETKRFKVQKVNDEVRVLKLSDGYFFADKYTDFERKTFKT